MNSPDRPSPPTTILAIDSDRDRWLATFLGRWGYRVCYAITGQEGLEKARREYPRLILLEVEMPDLDGYEICRRLKHDPETREIPVIFMGRLETNKETSRDRDILKGFAIGGADFISKPFHTSEVLARIHHQLTLRELQHQLKRQNQELQQANRELHRTKAELEASQAKFKGILEIADEAIISVDENQIVQIFNQGAERIFGYAAKEMIGRSLEVLLPEESRQDHIRYIRNFARSQTISRRMAERSKEVRGRRQNGEEFPAEASISQLQLQDGWLFTVMLKDISDRRQVEMELRAAKNDLEDRIGKQTAQLRAANERLRQEIHERRDSEEKFRQLAENIRDVFYIHEFDDNFKSLYISPAFERIWGIPREELYRNPYVWLEFIHPDDRDRVASRTPQAEDFLNLDCEYRIVRPNGEIRWIRDRAFPVRNEEKQIYRLTGIAEDITERKRAEARLQTLNQRLENLIAERTVQLQSANAELREQKYQLEAIAANIPDGAVYRAIVRTNGSFSLIYISEGIEKIAGRDRDLIQSHPQSLLELLSPETSFPLKKHLQAALDTLEPSRVNFCITTDGAGEKWLQNHSSFYRLENGDIIADGLILDISDRITAETALRESEERFRIIFEQTPTAINLTNSSGCFLSVNSKCCEIFGYDRAELLKMRFQDVIHPEDLPENLNREAQLVRGERSSYSLEKRFLRKDGTVRWGRTTVSVIRDEGGNAKYFLTALEDIHELKEWQAALEHQIQRQLLLGEITTEIRQSLDSEQIFQTTTSKIGEAFGVDCCVLHRYLPSPALRVPLVAEYLGEGAFSLSSWDIPIRDNPHLEQLLAEERAIASDEIARDSLLKALQPICTRVGIQSLLCVATFYNGEPNGIICLHQCRRQHHWTREEIESIEAIAAQVGIALAQADLLEREKQRQEELAYKNAALKQASRAAEAANLTKSEFLANMSHEIRTPMNAILGFCDLLQERVAETRSRSYLESIKASGKTLLTLIDDLLDLSKIEAGKLQLHYESISLYGLIEEISIFFSEQARQKALQWIVDIDPDVPPFPIFDEVRLRQILFNVVGNALKFTESGHIKISVTSHQSPVTRHPSPVTSDALRPETSLPKTPSPSPHSLPLRSLEIAIEDTGIGIAPEQQDAIFEAFKQNEGQSTRKYGGTGLGLAITKRLTEMLGGEVQLRSVLGKGSTFTFLFPQLQCETDAPASRLQSMSGDRFQQFPPLTILVADDIPSNRNLIAGYFADSLHHLLLAENGREALEIARSHNLDLILLDLRMPELDGWEVARTLKANFKTRNIPLLILTAVTWLDNEEELRSLCDGFLRKPIDRDRLVAAMEIALLSREGQETTTRPCDAIASPVPISGELPSGESLENLPELLQKLQQYEQTTWLELRQTLKMRDLKQCAKQITQWGKEYRYQPAIEYANILSCQLTAFDWHNIPKTIESFSQLKVYLKHYLLQSNRE
ncbi:MAG: PAS domain S-box protein [Cyanobacteria bacterium SBLK]|nr:PAS domain S-box protein [Cyanobacteria bacterium SBLK]